MRKALLGFLMAATMATPVVAQEVSEMPERYQRRAAENQARYGGGERQRAERVERVESQRSERPMQQRFERRAQQREERRGAVGRGFEQPVQHIEHGREAQHERAQRVYPADMPERYRRQWDRNAARVEQQDRENSHRGTHRRYERDHRDLHRSNPTRREHRDFHREVNRDHNSYHQRWDRNWRRDSRYDWQRHRYSNRDIFSPGYYYSPYRNHRYNRFSVGVFLDNGFYSNRYRISNPWNYRLPQAFPGTQWVRYYDDVLLVDLYTGEVIDVIYDFFW